MYLGNAPMLTKGSFALYYGGEEIIPLLSDKSGSLVSPVFMGSSMIFQLSFLIFKKIRLLKLTPNVTYSGMYLNNMLSTLLNGFSNTHTIPATIIFTASGFIFTILHYSTIEAKRRENVNKLENKNLENIPLSIYYFAGILFSLNIAQFLRNYALRKFARKKAQEFFQVDQRLSKFRKKSIKVVPFVVNDDDEAEDPDKEGENMELCEQTEAREYTPEKINKRETENENEIKLTVNHRFTENEQLKFFKRRNFGLAEVEI